MNPRIHLAAGALLLSATIFGTLACAQQPTNPPQQPATTAGPGHPASMEMHKAMMQGATMAMPMSGDVDKDFATMMTMHHRQAIAMIDVYLQHGDDDGLKALAHRMKQGQQKEITELAPHTK